MTKVFDASGNLVLATGTDVSNIGVVNVGTVGHVDHSGPPMATKGSAFHEWVQSGLAVLAEEHGISVDELILAPGHTLTLRTTGDVDHMADEFAELLESIVESAQSRRRRVVCGGLGGLAFKEGWRYMVLDEPRVQDPPHQHYGPIIKGKRGKPRRW